MESTWPHRLRAAGLRVTRPRLAVLEALAGSPHADADAIVTAARADHPALSPQAVYGVLKALVGTGLARRIEPATRSASARVISVPISFKEQHRYVPDAERIARVAGLARRLATLRHKPNAAKRIAIVLSNAGGKAQH